MRMRWLSCGRLAEAEPTGRFQRFGIRARRGRFLILFPFAVVPVLNGCAGSSAGPGLGAPSDAYDRQLGVSSSRRVVASGPVPKGGGDYKLGRPYQVEGRWYVPREEPYYDRTGIASWYGADFHGRRTANGEVYDMSALTAAHPTLPMPSYAYVTNLRNGRTILVRVNDRGPYVADRVIDLSKGCATALGMAGAGLGRVRVRWAGHAPLDGNDRREQAFLHAQPWYGGDRVARAEPTPGWVASPRYERAEQLPWRQRTASIPDRSSEGSYDYRERPDDLSWAAPQPRMRTDDEAYEEQMRPQSQWSPLAHRENLSANINTKQR